METKKVRSSWTEETLETLVELWREHPCLYDVSHELYQNRVQKEESWREVAALLQQPGEQVFGGTPVDETGVATTPPIKQTNIQQQKTNKEINRNLLVGEFNLPDGIL